MVIEASDRFTSNAVEHTSKDMMEEGEVKGYDAEGNVVDNDLIAERLAAMKDIIESGGV